jgi:hypothetical protein
VLLAASLAPKKDAPGIRFPDSRIAASQSVFPGSAAPAQ